MVRIFFDTGAFITAFKARDADANKLLELLDDEGTVLVTSEYSRLELISHPTFLGRTEEVEFYQLLIGQSEVVPSSEAMRKLASELGCRYGLGGFDSLLVAAAVVGSATQFLTSEKETKPMHRIRELRVERVV